jgi:O-succinylbenzoic acid--CoA ligase
VYDGVPLPNVEILLQEHPDLPEATVTVGGPTIASGYLGRPDLSAAVFAEGRFASSDLGRWRDGRLQLLGRSDGVVKIAGSKVPLAGVADVLRRDSRVLDATVTAHPDLEWDHHLNAYVVPVDEALVGTPEAEALAESLADRVTQAFGGATRPRSMAIVAELPVTASGKPVVAVSRIH